MCMLSESIYVKERCVLFYIVIKLRFNGFLKWINIKINQHVNNNLPSSIVVEFYNSHILETNYANLFFHTYNLF